MDTENILLAPAMLRELLQNLLHDATAFTGITGDVFINCPNPIYFGHSLVFHVGRQWLS